MRQHVPEYRRQLPEPDLYGLDPAGLSRLELPVLADIEGRRVKITGRMSSIKESEKF